jgi:hypothetical protein
MSDRIEEIRDRWAAATPGPWHTSDDDHLFIDLDGADGRVCVMSAVSIDPTTGETDSTLQRRAEADVTAIVHAPEDVAWLLAEVERQAELIRGPLSAEISEAREQRDEALALLKEALHPIVHLGPYRDETLKRLARRILEVLLTAAYQEY